MDGFVGRRTFHIGMAPGPVRALDVLRIDSLRGGVHALLRRRCRRVSEKDQSILRGKARIGSACRTSDGAVDWDITTGTTTATRIMSLMGPMLPLSACRSRPVLSAMGAVAGRLLGIGRVQLTGTTSNRQHFDANPLRIWYVTDSRAVVDGEDLGPVGPLDEQAHMADFYFPQRGIFAVGRVFISPLSRSDRRLGSLNTTR